MKWRIICYDGETEKQCAGRCGRSLSATTQHFPANKQGKYGLHSVCRKCAIERAGARFRNNPELYKIKRASLNRNNPNATREYAAKWRSANLAVMNAHAKIRHKRKAQATPTWSEADAIKSVYEGARYLSRLTGVRWDVDHIVPLRSAVVCGLHVLANLQYLPHTANLAKGFKVSYA